MSYEVEIMGGDRDPPPRYTYHGLGGVSHAIKTVLLRALGDQRTDGRARTVLITLPNVRSLPEQDRRERRRTKDSARHIPDGSSPEDVAHNTAQGAAPTRRKEPPRW